MMQAIFRDLKAEDFLIPNKLGWRRSPIWNFTGRNIESRILPCRKFNLMEFTPQFWMELSPQEFYPQFWLEMSPRKCPHTRKRKCPHRNCLYRKRPQIDERNFPRRNSHYRNSPYRNLVTNWMENSRAKRVFCFVYIRSTFNWLTAWFAIITFLVTLILFQAFLPNLN